MKKFQIFTIILILTLFQGCNGSGSSNTDTNSSETTDINSSNNVIPNTLIGKFIDLPVEGLKYSTITHSDYTNSLGEFSYKAGEIITFDDLEAKKPFGYGISAKDYKKVIGKKINKNISKWNFLNEKDIYE